MNVSLVQLVFLFCSQKKHNSNQSAIVDGRESMYEDNVNGNNPYWDSEYLINPQKIVYLSIIY